MNDLKEIFKDYRDVRLTKDGFSVSFDSVKDAMKAFDLLTESLKEMDKDNIEEQK